MLNTITSRLSIRTLFFPKPTKLKTKRQQQTDNSKIVRVSDLSPQLHFTHWGLPHPQHNGFGFRHLLLPLVMKTALYKREKQSDWRDHMYYHTIKSGKYVQLWEHQTPNKFFGEICIAKRLDCWSIGAQVLVSETTCVFKIAFYITQVLVSETTCVIKTPFLITQVISWLLVHTSRG